MGICVVASRVFVCFFFFGVGGGLLGGREGGVREEGGMEGGGREEGNSSTW